MKIPKQQEIIAQLVAKLEILLIFISEAQYSDKEAQTWILISEDKHARLTEQQLKSIKSIFQEYDISHYLIFSFNYLYEQIAEENLFFIQYCLPQNIVYRNSDFDESKLNSLSFHINTLDHIKYNINQELNKATSFLDGANFYIEQNNLEQTSFMLHQYMELLLRALGLFTIGREKVSHSIKEQQIFLQRFIPDLGGLFHEEIENEQRVLKLLDEAYIKVRYSRNFEITEGDLNIIIDKADWLDSLVHSILDKHLSNFQLKYPTSPAKNEKNPNTNSNELNLSEDDHRIRNIINILKTKVALHTVFIIDTHKDAHTQKNYFKEPSENISVFISYTLLIITEKKLPISFSELMDVTNKLLEKEEVFIIQYTENMVFKFLDRGCNFLDNILTKALPVYHINESFISCSHRPSYHEQVWKRINKIWQTRYRRASFLCEVLEDQYQEMLDEPLTKLHILNCAVEQVCLGMLYVFWEFKPSHYSIPYLLHLCKNFSGLPEDIFDKSSHRKHHSYDLIRTAPYQMRFKTKTQLHKKEVERAYRLGVEFIRRASEEAFQELDRIKKFHFADQK
jgi:HEPN domain-containing protein